MQAKGNPGGKGNLYDFWKDAIYGKLREETDCIVNLASKEYSRCVEDWLTGDFDFNLKVICASSDELEQIHRKIKSIPGVSATRTHFALKEVKNVYAAIPGE